MKRKCSNLKYIKREKGSVLITILMILATVSILGMGLLSVSASNFKQTGTERDFQAVYYIAEAGINQSIYDMGIKVDDLSGETLSHVEFFGELNNFINIYMSGGVKTINNFEESFGEKPVATITIEVDGALEIEDESTQTKGTTNYIIKSVGKIGNLSRTVSTSIEVAHGITKETVSSHHPAFDYALYSPSRLSLPNQSKIDGGIYSKDIILNSAGTQISRDIISETFVDIRGNDTHPRVKGDVYALNGYAYVATGGFATVEGNVNANGNVIVGSNGTVEKNIHSNGNVEFRSPNGKVLGNLHAKGNVILRSGTLVGKNAYLNGNLELLNSNSTINGNVFAGKDIYMQNNTNILGTSQAGGSINKHNVDNVNMEIHPNNKPISPSFPIVEKVLPPDLSDFSSDMSKNINVPQSSSNYVVTPGTYGNLYVNGGSTVTLKSGNYFFNSIDGARWGQSLRLDLSEGPINIYSIGDIGYAGYVFVSENGYTWIRMDNLDKETAIRLAGKVYWETHGNFKLVNMGDSDSRQWFGTVYAKKNITVGNPVKLIGAYSTNTGTITMGNAPEVTYAPPTDSAAGGSGGSGGVNEEGKNNIPSENRITTSSPIREK